MQIPRIFFFVACGAMALGKRHSMPSRREGAIFGNRDIGLISVPFGSDPFRQFPLESSEFWVDIPRVGG